MASNKYHFEDQWEVPFPIRGLIPHEALYLQVPSTT